MFIIDTSKIQLHNVKVKDEKQTNFLKNRSNSRSAGKLLICVSSYSKRVIYNHAVINNVIIVYTEIPGKLDEAF